MDSPNTPIKTGYYHAEPNAPLPTSSIKKTLHANLLVQSHLHGVEQIRKQTAQRQIDRQEAVHLLALTFFVTNLRGD